MAIKHSNKKSEHNIEWRNIFRIDCFRAQHKKILLPSQPLVEMYKNNLFFSNDQIQISLSLCVFIFCFSLFLHLFSTMRSQYSVQPFCVTSDCDSAICCDMMGCWCLHKFECYARARTLTENRTRRTKSRCTLTTFRCMVLLRRNYYRTYKR